MADDVAARILEVAEARGFRPNRIAAGLRTQRSGPVGVVLPDIANPVFPPIPAGIEAVLAQQGYVPIVVNAGLDKVRQRFVIDQLVGRQVEGLLLATAEREDPILDYCLKQRIPAVMINRGEDAGRASCVVSDNLLAMRLTVDHRWRWATAASATSPGRPRSPPATSAARASCRRCAGIACAARRGRWWKPTATRARPAAAPARACSRTFPA